MGLIDDLLKAQSNPKCENCENMVIIHSECWGCRYTDKMIIPEYPPYHGGGNNSCDGYKRKGEKQNGTMF